MAARVAVDGDVTATAGATPYTGAESGTWTAGPITSSSYSALKSGGRPVIWKAECTFAFSGASSSGAAVAGQETVTLTATTKLVNKHQNNVLVDGDEASGTYGNKLSVIAGGLLETN